MISSLQDWQWALLEVLLIIILQRVEERLYWLTSTFATLLNSLKAKAAHWGIRTSAESFDRAAANCYWLSGGSERLLLMIKSRWKRLREVIAHRLPLWWLSTDQSFFQRWGMWKNKGQANATGTRCAVLSIASLLSWASVSMDYPTSPPPGLLISPALPFLKKATSLRQLKTSRGRAEHTHHDSWW